ncbi:hypothetical protein HCN44_004536 [Aphidius gifuensis]|uniref:Uncharacterized protein n=1 Tax=Aphidius gifuensis TaxID=684658 RepID=A0A834Y0Z3_APHGI|nr:hypothetical protein HCN44_004536 [Aphidius gifuensis]
MSARKKSILTNIKNKNTCKSKIATTSDPQLYNKLDYEEKNNDKDTVLLDVDKLSSDELNNSIERVKKNPIEPFKFLTNIIDDSNGLLNEKKIIPKQTEIDIKLATLSRRIQMNKSILEKAFKRVKDIDFLVEPSIINSIQLSSDDDSFEREILSDQNEQDAAKSGE